MHFSITFLNVRDAHAHNTLGLLSSIPSHTPLAKSVYSPNVLHHSKIGTAHKHVHPRLECDVGEGGEGE